MSKSKFLFLIMALITTIFVNAQGIDFEKAPSWKDVLAKAKAENKFIFVDCYTTWCGPCKAMEKQVYPLASVGDYYNQHFISIKLQMDSTASDDSLIKSWYALAKRIETSYSINEYPAFLFFDADGNPLHKVIGGQSASSFIQIAKDARAPEKQYYNIIKNYVPDKIDTGELKGIATLFRYDNAKLAGKMLKDYFDRIPKREWARKDNLEFLIQLNTTKEAGLVASYILSKQKISHKNRLSLFNAFQNDSLVRTLAFDQLKNLPKYKLAQNENLELLTIFNNVQKFKNIADNFTNSFAINEALSRDNIILMRSFMKSCMEKSFQFFFTNGKEIDSVMQKPKYTETLLCKIITNELIEPIIKKSQRLTVVPDWNDIAHAIEAQYGNQYAERCIAMAKPGYYQSEKHWKEYAKNLIRYVDTYASIEPKSAFYLNNMAYEVFENTGDKNDLERANYWMDIALQSDTAGTYYGAYMSTKAEVLYKLGLKDASIGIMEKAIETDKRKNPGGADWYKELDMMKRGEKIWSEKVDGQ